MYMDGQLQFWSHGLKSRKRAAGPFPRNPARGTNSPTCRIFLHTGVCNTFSAILY
jgi:hypothetical protein